MSISTIRQYYEREPKERRKAYEQAVDLINLLSWLVDSMYSHEDPTDRMHKMTAIRNTQKKLTKVLKPLVEENPLEDAS
tara:strand:+ start:354 stop:590 length:237 start_codon:yes stop_codon:yes gene_type:complete